MSDEQVNSEKRGCRGCGDLERHWPNCSVGVGPVLDSERVPEPQPQPEAALCGERLCPDIQKKRWLMASNCAGC